MFRLLDQRDGYRLGEITSISDLDLETFVPMVDAAWALDYVDQPRLIFDESYLAKVMGGSSWLAVVACADAGEPVGFEIAFERTLYVRGEPLEAYYVSVFTVSANHRRRGLGSWVLEGINRLVFEERGADLIVSTFHDDHAGSPAVQSTFDRIADWGVDRFHRTPIWSRRLDKDPFAPLADPPPWAELQLDDGGNETAIRAAEGHATVTKPTSLAELDDELRSGYELSFALEASLAEQYLMPGNPASATHLYDFGDEARCLCCFNLSSMAINDHRLRPIGQLQMLHAPDCSEDQVAAALHQLGLHLTERGCFAMTVTDLGMIPRKVLEQLRFAPSDDGIAFAARGPRASLDRITGIQPPYFLDFT